MLKLPPPFWTLVYVLIGTAISWSLGWPRLPGLALQPLGFVLVVLSFFLAVWAVTLYRRERAGLNPTFLTTPKLVTGGLFRFTRKPMYLGLVTVTLGIAFWVGAWPMFAAAIALFVTANWVHFPFEEAKMQRRFGTEFDDYVRKVRRWV
jgi:protein-S-isoprenylcysteine O-methyltransferase Ste14